MMNGFGGYHHGVVPPQLGHRYPIRGQQVVYAHPTMPVAGPSYTSTIPPMQGLPQPPPVVAYDVNEFRNFFRFGLNQLHANSKYIINDLTTLAGTFQHRMATVVSKELEQFLRIVSLLSVPLSLSALVLCPVVCTMSGKGLGPVAGRRVGCVFRVVW